MNTEGSCTGEVKIAHRKVSDYSTYTKFFFFFNYRKVEVVGQAALVPDSLLSLKKCYHFVNPLICLG